MQARELERVEKSLEGFLAGLTASMGRSKRRHWAGVYVRGLLLDGERKVSVTKLGKRQLATAPNLLSDGSLKTGQSAFCK